MIPAQLFHDTEPNGLPLDPSLASPKPSLLARYLDARLEAEEGPQPPVSLPAGVRADLRPMLPPIGRACTMLFAHRRAVQSYPLLFTALALAHPN